jgi:hypothetical protein
MSQNAIFVVGIIIFAITVYGTVMAGGIALTKVAMDDEALPAVPAPGPAGPPTHHS